MTRSNPDRPSWASTSPGEAAHEAPDPWQPTRAQTQLADDEDDYLASGRKDIGRPVGDNVRELFVSCDAGPAMQQQFEFLRPEFIAIHDVATHSSLKLIGGVAAASKSAVQKLVIRRQGHGTTLATLEFVELPAGDGATPLRIYSTEIDADTTSRHAIARTLLAFSTLGVMLVGDLPNHALAAQFKPLHDDMMAGPWPNRHLLLLPLSSANALVTQGMELARGTGVNVRTTPQVKRPADAWAFITGAWGRLREELRAEASRGAAGSSNAAGSPGAVAAPGVASAPASAPAASRAGPASPNGDAAGRPTGPLPLRPMPAVPTRGARDAEPSDPLQRYVHKIAELTGMVSCCVFDIATGRDVAHAGASPGAVELGKHGRDLLAAMQSTSRTLGLGHALPEAAITLGAHHLVLRAVPKHPGLALHAVLDKTHSNLTLARLQIMRMDALLEEVRPPS